MEEWRVDVPADCVFIDQIGARPWRLDFNPLSSTPLAYDDGWLALVAPYANRCLMVEDGWDRLAQSSVGFHGSLLQGDRADDYPNLAYGRGNWEPYPLALWLLHDKVLMYQHALYDGTMTADPEVLRWNMAFGLMLSYSWDATQGTLDSPWLGLVGAVQSALGPLFAGAPLTGYREVAPGVTESSFGDVTVLASWSSDAGYETDGYGIAPGGFLARSRDGSVLAGAFTDRFGGVALSAGTHYVVVERGPSAVVVREPIGGDTTLALDPPASWSAGRPLSATAYNADGHALEGAEGELRNGRFELQYAATVGGRPAAYYRLSAG